MSNSRQIILGNIIKALNTASQVPNLYSQSERQIIKEIISNRPKTKMELWKQFSEELQAVSGEFSLFQNADGIARDICEFLKNNSYKQLAISDDPICQEIAEKIKSINRNIEIIQATIFSGEERKSKLACIPVSLVAAHYAAAETGSIIFLYDRSRTSYPHFLSETVFTIVNYNNIVADIFELFEQAEPQQVKNMVIVTGPSRTADIEKILILGAHGPRRLIVATVSE